MSNQDIPSFFQVFYEDNAIEFAFDSVRKATKNWMRSQLVNETILLNDIAESLTIIGERKCISPIYPDIYINTKRAILDRAANDNSDMFGSDLGLTLSMYEDGKLAKQRTALIQLKVGKREETGISYKLDVRQIYRSGHNRHSLGRWFLGVCEKTHGIWSFGTERQIGEALTQKQLEKAQFPTSADRIVTQSVEDNWRSLSQWVSDWLSGSIGKDSDLSDDNRIEKIIERLLQEELKKKSGQILNDDFERQFAASAPFLPRIHLHLEIREKKFASE